MSDIKDMKTLVNLQAIISQNVVNMQEMQKQLQEYIKNSEERANYFVDNISNQLPDKLIKPLKESIDVAKLDIKNITIDAKTEFEKIKFYKPFLIHSALFVLVTIFAYVFIYIQKSSIDTELTELKAQRYFIEKYGKNITLNNCNFNNKLYPCVKIQGNQPTYTSKDGETYALVKK